MKKSKITIIFIFSLMILSIPFTACKNKTKQIPLSELIDWNKANIKESGYPEWAPALVQNNTYVFYENMDWEIIRVDKKSRKTSIIRKLKKLRDSPYDVGMALSNDTLYYMYDFCLYQCDFNGGNIKQLVSKQKLLEFTKNTNIQGTVNGIKIYKNNLYLIIGNNVMVKYDFDTKNFQLLAQEAESGEFYKGNFYYVDSTAIYKVDLQTSEKKLVRGQKWSKKFLKSDDIVYYQGVMKIKGKLYYACYQGKWVSEGAAPSKLYLYKENRKDVKKYDASVTLFHPVYNGGKIVYHKVNIKKNKFILVIYDLKTGQERKMDLPKDFSEAKQLIDDILLYRSDKKPTYSIFKIH